MILTWAKQGGLAEAIIRRSQNHIDIRPRVCQRMESPAAIGKIFRCCAFRANQDASLIKSFSRWHGYAFTLEVAEEG